MPLALILSLLLATTSTAAARVPIVGGNPEEAAALFDGLPGTLQSVTRIAPADEPGEPMVIDGVVRDADGRTVAGIIIYAYHTNHFGIYPRDRNFPSGSVARRHGRLRGWAVSDAEGRFRFETIRPGGYPLMFDAPAHVHLQVLEPGRCTYLIHELLFNADTRLTERQREIARRGRGGIGLGNPVRDPDGRWRVRRDIVLGANIPDYPPRN